MAQTTEPEHQHPNPETHTAEPLGRVSFADPLTEDTRKIKKFLLAAATIVVLLYPFDIRVNSLFGFIVFDEKVITKSTIIGVGGIISSYFLVRYVLAFFVDYQAWFYKNELVSLDYYSRTIERINSELERLARQLERSSSLVERANVITSAPNWIEQLIPNYLPEDMHPSEVVKLVSSLSSQLNETWSGYREFTNKIVPELERLERYRIAANLTRPRLLVRLISFWVIDFALPLAVAALAIYRSWTPMGNVLRAIAA